MAEQQRLKTVIEVVAQLASEVNDGRRPEVKPRSHLEWDLGLGSIERHELLLRLERALGENLSSQEVFQAATVAELAGVTVQAARTVLTVPEVKPGQRLPEPTAATDLISALDYQAQGQGERKMLHLLEDGQPGPSLSYAELWQRAGVLAGALVGEQVQKGDRVGIMLPTGVDYLATFYAVLWIGAIPVPIYPPFRLDQLEDYIRRQSAILKVAGAGHLISFQRARAVVPLLRMQCPGIEVLDVEKMRGEAPPVNVSEVGLIQFTSGSTGLPKGVVLTHEALLANIRAYGEALELRPDDVTISWLPLYHDMGLIGALLGSIYHGCPLALMGPQDFLARPSRWLTAVTQYRGTISPAPNFAYEICATKLPDSELEGLDLSSWRVALNGAEAVRPETLQRFTQRFAPYGFDPAAHFPAYGLAEASLAVTFPPPGRGPLLKQLDREVLETEGEVVEPREHEMTLVGCGRALPGMEVRIVDQQGRPLDDLRRGLIEFRGPSSLREYYDNPEASAKVKNTDGWVNTGDLGFLEAGELFITGRVKDLIVKAGRNLHPEDVEEVVAGVEGVRRGCIAAFGVADEKSGTEALVIVAESRQKKPEQKERLARAIEAEVSRRLGVPPDRILVVAPHTVPKTPSGKIRRNETRTRLQAGTLESRGGAVKQIASLVGQRVLQKGKQLARLPRRVYCLSVLSFSLLTPQLVGLFSRRAALAASATLARLYLKASGIRVEVKGHPVYREPCVVVVNHSSSLDPVVVTAAWTHPIRFMVAPWIANLPSLRYLIARLGHLAVRRNDPEAARRQEADLLRIVDEGDCLGVFPEGGIDPTPGLRPFAMGAFQIAARLGVPIVPVALQGSRQAQPWPEVIPHPGTITVTIGPPLHPEGEGFEQLLQLSREARRFIHEHCGDPLVHQRLRRTD